MASRRNYLEEVSGQGTFSILGFTGSISTRGEVVATEASTKLVSSADRHSLSTTDQ
jgi:hypothetical protein